MVLITKPRALLLGLLPSLLSAAPLTLDEAVAQAIQHDPWLTASEQSQTATLALSTAAGVRPDPKFSLAMVGLPTDTFDFEQEAMTQLQFGVSQMFPRGETLALKREQLRQQGDLTIDQRAQRRAEVQLKLSQQWLDALQASMSAHLIEQNRSLFEQLIDIAEQGYRSALMRTNQQDMVRAELELDQLQERLSRLRQQQDMAEQALLNWLPMTEPSGLLLQQTLPELDRFDALSHDELERRLLNHPSIRELDRRITLAGTTIELAKQSYEPEWVLQASYGIRGANRADLINLGVSVDLPLFSKTRQDSQVSAEVYQQSSLRSQRALLLRTLHARYQTIRAELARLEARLTQYQARLIPGFEQVGEVAVNAYTSDSGSFSEVVQARIGELNARLAQLRLTIEQRKKLAELTYLLNPYGKEGRQ